MDDSDWEKPLVRLPADGVVVSVCDSVLGSSGQAIDSGRWCLDTGSELPSETQRGGDFIWTRRGRDGELDWRRRPVASNRRGGGGKVATAMNGMHSK
jgi:hypothetical protein